MKIRLLLFGLLGLAFLSACSKSNGGSSSPEPQQVMTFAEADTDCEKFRASLPLDWQQGFLNVPENLDQPNGQRIQIFYYGKINPNSVPTV